MVSNGCQLYFFHFGQVWIEGKKIVWKQQKCLTLQ
nr:MAG TPA: hypothetical protein [Caudoviricetes sp.]